MKHLRVTFGTAMLVAAPLLQGGTGAPDLVDAAKAGHPPSFEQVLGAKFDQTDHAAFDRLRTWAERPTPEERTRYMVKIGSSADGTAMWRDRVPCWQADRKGLARAMVVAVNAAPDRATALRRWSDAQRVYASIPQIERQQLHAAKSATPNHATAIAKELAWRHVKDQAWRTAQFDRAYDDATSEVITWRVWSVGCHADHDNLIYIQHVVDTNTWPLISRDGEDAARHAFLLVQHADDDPDFQERVLAMLEQLVATKEANGKSYALLFDRVALARHRLQRYGTQVGTIAGCIAVRPVEDHANLDIRRASVGLAPLRGYARTLEGVYHAKACEDLFASVELRP